MTVASDPWQTVRAMTDNGGLTVGPQLAHAILARPDRLALMFSRYWVASKLIGGARTVLEVGCSEGSGAGLLAAGRDWYTGVDTDRAAITFAQSMYGNKDGKVFACRDLISVEFDGGVFDAAVSLDVIEHIPQPLEDRFLASIAKAMTRDGICVIGTPNATFEHLASAESNAGHINLFAHDRLKALMEKHFRVVVMAGMNDTSLHFGHPEARHYHLAVGYGPRS